MGKRQESTAEMFDSGFVCLRPFDDPTMTTHNSITNVYNINKETSLIYITILSKNFYKPTKDAYEMTCFKT